MAAPLSPTARPSMKRKAEAIPTTRAFKRPRSLSTDSTPPRPSSTGPAAGARSFQEEVMQADSEKLRTMVLDMQKQLLTKEEELRQAHRLIRAHEEEKDMLHKKWDSDNQRANKWEHAHDALKMELDEVNEQVVKLAQEKNKALAKVLQEQSLNIVKQKEVRGVKRELDAVVRSYQDLLKRHEQLLGKKQAAQDISGYELRSKADRKKEKEQEPRIVQCTQCFTKGWACDAGRPCQACIARGIPGGCKRVKCQFWAKGTCKKSKCGLAHEDDGFSSVIEHRKIKQKPIPMPEELKKALEAQKPVTDAQKAIEIPTNHKYQHENVGETHGNSNTTQGEGQVEETLAVGPPKEPTREMEKEHEAAHEVKPVSEDDKEEEQWPVYGGPFLILPDEKQENKRLAFYTFTAHEAYSHFSLEEYRVGEYHKHGWHRDWKKSGAFDQNSIFVSTSPDEIHPMFNVNENTTGTQAEKVSDANQDTEKNGDATKIQDKITTQNKNEMRVTGSNSIIGNLLQEIAGSGGSANPAQKQDEDATQNKEAQVTGANFSIGGLLQEIADSGDSAYPVLNRNNVTPNPNVIMTESYDAVMDVDAD